MAGESDSKEVVPLWLDCDPGHDDAFAILLAAHHESLHLLGISTVHGNASLEKTTANAGSVVTAIGKPELPVFPGAKKPFCRNAVHAPEIHGATGLDGTELPKATCPPIRGQNAVVAMRVALMTQPKGTPWLVATGALTNVALLFATYPEVATHIKGLSIMGGAVGAGFAKRGTGEAEGDRIGNETHWAEFNIYCDPEAAQAIFSDPVLAAKTTLIPLDLTHQVIVTEDVRRDLLRKPTDGNDLARPEVEATVPTLRTMLHDLLVFFGSTYAKKFGFSSGPPLHDPVAVAVLLTHVCPGERLDFDDRGGERWHVDVVTDGVHSDQDDKRGQLGRTIVRAVSGEGGVRIPRGLNLKRFWAIIEGCLQRAEALLAEQQVESGLDSGRSKKRRV
ncbi:Uridine nucleosidase 1 [Pseudocyphellaria aurata]|nr:Uridine nucleosidase 1 [Pseudocyphellaria aurata]